MRLLTLTIQGQGKLPSYQIPVPSQIAFINSLSLQYLVSFAISLLLSVIVLLSFIFVLVGGLKWITSQGDKKQVEGAQKTITFAIVGLVIAFLSFFILNLIGFVFGVPLTGH